MTSLIRITLACALGALSFASCKQGADNASPTASGTSTARPALPSATPDAEDFCKGAPYRRRCDAGCKAAHAAAVTTTCGAETAAFNKAVPNAADFGKCLVGCRAPGTDSSCVGGADKPSCECALRCYKALPPDAVEKARTAARCYNKAVASACE